MSRSLIAALALMAAPCVSLAHHSAIRFDLTIRDRMVTGVVKEFEPANPHTKIVLEITDDKGTRDVEFEGHSRNNMTRQGLMPNMMTVGDTITVRIAPTRDGTDGGYVTALITKDGKSIGNITRAD
jgi:Family of unknown function (DUF6152)